MQKRDGGSAGEEDDEQDTVDVACGRVYPEDEDEHTAHEGSEAGARK